jgi:hypothetical protein
MQFVLKVDERGGLSLLWQLTGYTRGQGIGNKQQTYQPGKTMLENELNATKRRHQRAAVCGKKKDSKKRWLVGICTTTTTDDEERESNGAPMGRTSFLQCGRDQDRNFGSILWATFGCPAGWLAVHKPAILEKSLANPLWEKRLQGGDPTLWRLPRV